jgi:succinyl-diaminopimelate desuccinylase
MKERQEMNSLEIDEINNVTSILRSLVRIPTENPPGNTREIVEFLSSLSQINGFNTTIFGNDNKKSILIMVGKKGPTFLLNAHLDTVPVGDISKWTIPPFEGIIKGGRMYGRGAADNKGGVTAAFLALLSLKTLIANSNFRVCGLFVADEEVGGMEGTGKIISDGSLNGLNVRGAIVCDGSGLVDSKWGVRTDTKGMLHIEITMLGIAAHAARPAQGKNAVLAMSEALLKISQISFKGIESDELLGLPTLVPGSTISGGTAINAVPGICTATIDSRLTPKSSSEKIYKEVKAIAKSAANSWGCKAVIKILQNVDAIVINQHDLILQDTLNAIKEVTSQDAVVRGLEGSNDAKYLIPAGITTIPGLSPSDSAKSRSHGVDESIGLEDVVTASKIYAATIRRWSQRILDREMTQ